MIQLPLRVEIKCDDHYLRFTIVSAPFTVSPVKGDPIDFNNKDWPTSVMAITQYVYHSIGELPGSIVCCTVNVGSHEEMILTFDMFKDTFAITDLDTGGNRPPPYYVFYRTVIKLWGKKTFEHGVDHPAALSELLRSICVAAGKDPIGLSKLVELVHNLIIADKQKRRSSHLDILSMIRLWYNETDLGGDIGDVDGTIVAPIYAKIMSTYKSVPPDKLPACVSDRGM